MMCAFMLTFECQSQDTTPPELRCKTGLVVVLPVSGTITVTASEFDDGSSDDITSYGDLKFYLNGDPNLTSYTVNCDTFVDRDIRGEYTRSFFLHVEDEAGNVSICGTMLRVQDNKFVCGDPYVECSGCPYLWYNDDLINAFVNCEPTTRGCYNVVLDTIREISYCLDEEYLSGVTTKDLVQMQRHLLGITPFEHPFQMVAADVNNSQSVSAADISSLRKVILGSEPDFQRWGLDSYRFIVQSDTINPVYTGVLVFEDLGNCPENLDFWAIKTGDVAFDGEQFDDIQVRQELFGLEQEESLTSYIYTVRSKSDMEMAAFDLRIEGAPGPGLELRSRMGTEIHSHTNGHEIRAIWLSDKEYTRRAVGEEVLEIRSSDPLTGRLSIQVVDRGLRMYTQSMDIKSEDRVWVWPNPVKQGEEVTISGLDDQEYHLTDISGHLIKRIRLSEKEEQTMVRLDGMARGLYFLVSINGEMKARIIVN